MKNRYYTLDVMRGIAALSIIIYHWRGFAPFLNVGDSETSRFPFSKILSPVYHYGYLAVDFFFILSGFIFFTLYSQAISEKRISAQKFFILRFSRLYPLYIITFLFVCILLLFIPDASHYYKNNTIIQFLLSLTLLQGVSFAAIPSFNAPSWSISVELVCYSIFFILCRLKKQNIYFLLIIMMLGLLPNRVFSDVGPQSSNLGRGMFGFFLGGIIYFVYNTIDRRYIYKPSLFLAIILVIFTLVAYICSHNGSDFCNKLFPRFCTFIFFPSIILIATYAENTCGHMSKKIAWLGDISFSMYLIHYPLQMFIVLTIIPSFHQFVFHCLSLISYMFIVLSLSLLSFKYIEMPFQKKIRAFIR